MAVWLLCFPVRVLFNLIKALIGVLFPLEGYCEFKVASEISTQNTCSIKYLSQLPILLRGILLIRYMNSFG